MDTILQMWFCHRLDVIILAVLFASPFLNKTAVLCFFLRNANTEHSSLWTKMLPLFLAEGGGKGCSLFNLWVLSRFSLCFLGDSQPLDVCSIWNERKLLRYSVSLVGYGFYGDVVHSSEKHRWMGPVRYTYAGISCVKQDGRTNCWGVE